MQLRIAAGLVLAALASHSPAQRAVPPSVDSSSAPRTSWGKPGVSLDQYRADALTCGTRGYYADVSQTEAARTFVEGSRKIDAMLGIADELAVAQVVHAVRPEQRMKEVAGLLRETVAQCLRELGYSEFALSEDQRRRAARLRVGTPERRAYLHSLASDPRVLERQAVRRPRVGIEPAQVGEP